MLQSKMATLLRVQSVFVRVLADEAHFEVDERALRSEFVVEQAVPRRVPA